MHCSLPKNVSNNLSIKVLGYWVTFSKYRGLIVWLHKSHVMLKARAASASTWCYFQTSLVMPWRIFGPVHIKFRAVSTSSSTTPSREENKKRIERYLVIFQGEIPEGWTAHWSFSTDPKGKSTLKLNFAILVSLVFGNVKWLNKNVTWKEKSLNQTANIFSG